MTTPPPRNRLDRRTDPIFVGYLPTPLRDRRFLMVWIPLLLWGFVLLAIGLSLDQSSPGQGTWDTGHLLTLEGEVVPGPYPVLRVADPDSDAGVRSWLMVEQGKFGTQARVEALLDPGTAMTSIAVKASGFRIERDGRPMLELLPGMEGLQRLEGTTPVAIPKSTSTLQEPGRYRGEIVDAKCWLGVMKPGAGKPHKACATLCIGGGVPPMMVWFDQSGHRRRAVLVGQNGESVVDRIRNFIADPVELTGRLEQRDDLFFLRLDEAPDALRRTQ